MTAETFNRRVAPSAVVLLGLTASAPLYVHFGGQVGGAPIFYLQCAVVSALVCLYGFRHTKLGFTSLDQFVVICLIWLLISFLLNLPWMWLTGRSDLISRQLTSAATVLFTMSPYLLGRCYFDASLQKDRFTYSITLGLAIVIVGYAIFYSQNFSDLYLARRTIAQRIPMMIGFLAWAVCALGFWSSRRRYLLLTVWVGSMLIVVLSLTRAAYFQWFVSGVLFVVINLFRSQKRSQQFLWRLIAVGVFGCACLLGIATRSTESSSVEGPLAVIMNRAGQLFALREQVSSDESASGRVEIWRRLMGRLESSPTHMVVGFGQLGASAYLGGKFIDISGEVVDEYNAHSQYLDVLIRSGLIGLILECTLLVIIITKPFRVTSKSTELDFFKTHSIALTGILIYGAFHETLRWQMFGLYFWLYAGMVSRELYSRSSSVLFIGARESSGRFNDANS